MSSTLANARLNGDERGTPRPIKAYLIFFNLASIAGWSYILLQTVHHLFPSLLPFTLPQLPWERAAQPSLLARLSHPVYIPAFIPDAFVPNALVPLYKRAMNTYAAVGQTTAYVQSAASLEVLHVLLGFVRSPLPTTAMQVASRLFMVWVVVARHEAARTTPLYASMVLSWAMTEIIRYSFYASTLLGFELALLLWLRYTAFYVLYLTGAGSEAFVNFATLPSLLNIEQWDADALLRGTLFVLWWPCLYVLYVHMLKQRRKIYGGQKLGAKPKSA